MHGTNLSKTCDTVMNFFSKIVDQANETSKFVKRQSKLTARLFVETLVLGCLSDPIISLERLCRLLKEREVIITKQGLHERFNPQASELMKTLLSESFNQFRIQKNDVFDLFKHFSSIKIWDSSGIELPANLKDQFKGCGGNASEAALKLQVMFDYLQGQINEVIITERCRSDQGFTGNLEEIEQGGLYLQDLGYFKLKFFKQVVDKNAYFISRYAHVTLLDKTGASLDLLKELRQADSFFKKTVWMGEKEKIEIRLIAFRLSEQEVEKRLRKLKEKARKRKKPLKAETLELAKWSIYVTNIPECILNDQQIHLCYSLRWQIELLFKLSKSEAGIDKISSKKSDRVLCELYAKVICVVILLYLCFPVRWQEKAELSFKKAYKILKVNASDFFEGLKSPYRLLKFMKKFLSDLEDFALKDRYRKKRKLAFQKIMDATGQEVLV